jgi:signal transduction histidine kinase
VTGESDRLRASRARLAEGAIADRRRFERALHDGVQQDLISLSVELQLLRERIGEQPDLRASIDDLRAATRDALARVQALAAEIYPSALDARGLAGSSHRYPPEVEAAVALSAPTAIREEPGRLVVELSSTSACDLLEAAGATVSVEADGLRAEFTARGLM